MATTLKKTLAVTLCVILLGGLFPSALARGTETPEPLPGGVSGGELPHEAAETLAAGITVTVPDEDITLIAAKASWTAVEGVSAYTVSISSTKHAGLGTDNVWYQDNTSRTVKLANLHPGVTYTVTVSGGGETGSASFTTKAATNAKAQAAAGDPEAPAPYGALPDDQQLYYHKNDMASFIHFGPNTFNNREWGTGNESPSDFALEPGTLTHDPAYGDRQIPLYVDQWVKELQDAGFQRLIMVAKHHDGFCLWDTQYTDHNVMASPYGRDLLWDVSAACTKYDMDMGFYFSPWDMHDSSYGQGEAYNEYYMNQLREVLGNRKYGNNGVFVETWMDGAKGDNVIQEYDFDAYFKLIRELQPECLIYTDRADGGVRWSGNEAGSTGASADGTGPGDMCWQTMDVATQNYEGVDTPGIFIPAKPGGDTAKKWLRQRGQENGAIWAVCECDVSIENGWFGKNGNTVRSLDTLLEMYLSSAGYGSPLLLNLPPVTNGYFREASSQRLAELGKAIRDTFRTDMLREEGYTVTATADKTRASTTAGKFGAANLIDGDEDTYWTMDDGQTTGSVTIDLGGTRTFDVVTLKEYIALGQRIKEGKVEYHDEDGWHEFSTFTTVGAKRIMRVFPVKGDQIRVSITASNAVPLLSAVEVYKARSGMELSTGIPDGVVYVDDQAEGAIQYSDSGWTTRTGNDYFEQTNTYARSAASFTYTFSGSKVYVMGIKDAANGKFRVKIDDGAWTEVNTADTVFRQVKTILWTSDDLTDASHTVTVEWVSGWFDFDGLCYLPSGTSVVEFEESSYDAFPNGEVELKIIRGGSAATAATFKVVDLPNTAVQGQHYLPLTETVTMEPGVTEVTVRVQVLEGTSGNSAIGKDFSIAITDCQAPAVIGFNDEAVINIIDPESIPQEPQGETYTAEDPFLLPTRVGNTRTAEAEHLILDSSEAAAGKEVRIQTDDAASGGKKVGWFEPNNKMYLHYDAAVAGEYTVTLRYQSGRDSTNPNHINWRGENVESYTGSVVGPDSTGTVYTTAEFPFTVNEAGAGTLEFYADGNAGPNIDWFSFRLDAPAVDKSELQAAYDEAREVEDEGYTAASWEAFQQAIANALTVLYDADATQETVDAAAAALANAQKGLKKPPVSSAPVEVIPPFSETKPNEDGGSTTTEIRPDGTQVETTVRPDGTTEVVEVKVDGTVTETTTQPDGAKVEKVTDPEENVTVTATDADGEVLAQMNIPAVMPEKEVCFEDVPDGHWADKAIHQLAAIEVVNGVTDTLFSPVAPMKRGDLATVLYRLSNKPASGELAFEDVPESKYYAEGIAWAAKVGVVEGFTEEEFQPETVITREQLALMLTRYAKLLGIKTDGDKSALNAFADGGKTSTWAVDGVAWCVKAGIIQGRGENTLAPASNVTRAEVAVMIDRFLGLMK